MRDCFHPDDLVALSEVLGPDVHAALSHLEDCSTCQAHMRTVVEVRQALGERQSVDEAALKSVLSALRAERTAERGIAGSPRAAQAAEAVLAALTGPTLLYTSGVSVDPPSAVMFAAVCAAGVLVARRLERRTRLVAMG
jgi:anti-sigma factor RsiW